MASIDNKTGYTSAFVVACVWLLFYCLAATYSAVKSHMTAAPVEKASLQR
jgi:hypothetical protein